MYITLMGKTTDIHTEFFRKIQAVVTEAIAAILNVEPRHLDPEESHARHGVDSIIGIELIFALNKKYDLDLHETDLYSYPTIATLADYLQKTFSENFLNLLTPKQQKQLINSKKNNNMLSAKGNTRIPGTAADITGKDTDIAVIGMSGRFPGAESLDEFWENLVEGKNAITEVPASRWDYNEYFDPDPEKEGMTYSKWGGYLKEIDTFDASFFKISPREAELTDPQQRLFMEEAWKALESAGYADKTDAARCGVYVGVSEGDYRNKIEQAGIDATQFFVMVGNTLSILPARVSYFLNLKGPAIAVDTACSSSLVATHLACKSIINNENEIAIAGGVQVHVTPRFYIYASRGGMLSPDGQCRTFDTKANGFVYSEGVGAIVLKRLSSAVADKDIILGVIKGSAINQDGRTNGITAPNSESQSELEIEVYQTFGIDPATIDYVEAHGTGTKLGDPIEVEALAKAFRSFTDKKHFCRIGSVKTNIGHCQVAAGIAGIIKLLLCMRHEKIPATINISKENEMIDFERSPFIINKQLTSWKRSSKKSRRAAVSAFGFSGTNCHMVIEEAPQVLRKEQPPVFPLHIAAFSAKSVDSLAENIKKIYLWLKTGSHNYDLGDLCYTLNAKKKHFNYRLALLATGVDDLTRQLEFILQGIDRNKETWYGYFQQTTRFDSRFVKRLSKDFLNRLQLNHKMNPSEFSELLFRLFVSYRTGTAINWEKLYSDYDFRIVPVPAYCFDRKRYWIPAGEAGAAEIKQHTNNQAMHPLIDSNMSTLDQFAFSKVFIGDEFFLRDHIINGKKILPAAVYIEMIHAAGNLVVKDKKISSIENVSWLKPAIVENDPLPVSVLLEKQDKAVSFTLVSRDSEKNIHSQADIRYIDKYENKSETFTKIFKIDEIKKRCQNNMSKPAVYSTFSERGSEFGDTFQSIDEFLYNDKEAIAVLRIDASLKSRNSSYFLQPSIIDGAMQTSALFRYISHADEYLLPFNVASIDIYKSPGHECYAYCRNAYSEGTKTWRCDVSLLSKKGELLVQMNELLFRDLSTEKTKDNKETAKGLHFYYPSLKITHKNILSDKSFTGNNILLFDVDCELSDYMRAAGSSTDNIVLIKPGKTFAIEDEHTFFANPKKKSDIVNVCRNINFIPDNVIFLWTKKIADDSPGNDRDKLNISIASLFYIVHELAVNKWNSRVIFFYNGGQKHNKYFFSSMLGFGTVVEHELSRILFKTVELTGDLFNNSSSIYSVLAEEFEKNELFASYRGRDRYTISYQKYEMPAGQEDVQDSILYKANNVYLITGGTGKLGRIIARDICSKITACLVLTGRSPVDAEKESFLRELRESGSQAYYYAADVSHEDEVQKLIEKVKEKCGAINGIIHTAGTINDGLIINKTAEDFFDVIGPKIFGTLYLDRYTAQEALDFFILFSSTAAISGNQGQSDYAYANSFMDNYAYYRKELVESGERQGVTVSINWSVWEDGNMKPPHDVESQSRLRYGLERIDSGSGCGSLPGICNSGKAQLIVLKGDEQKLANIFNSIEHDSHKQRKSHRKSEIAGKHKIVDLINNYLSAEMSRILKIDRNDMLYDKELTDYGFDSVTLKELTNALNKTFNLELTASILFEYPTINEASAYILDNYEKQMLNYFNEKNIKNVVVRNENISIGNSMENAHPETASENKKTVQLLRKLADGEITIEDIKNKI